MPALTTVASQVMARRPVDLIHAHTTGTVEQDPAELLAYQRAMGLTHHFSARPVDVYAVKGALGHGLGASGLVRRCCARDELLVGRRRLGRCANPHRPGAGTKLLRCLGLPVHRLG